MVRTGDQAVVHVDGNGRGALIAIGVADGVDERFQRIPGRSDGRVGVVFGVAIGIDSQVAVLPMHLGVQLANGRGRGIAAGTHADHVLAITPSISTDHVIEHHVATHHVALGHTDVITVSRRHIVDNADDDGAGGRITQ